MLVGYWFGKQDLHDINFVKKTFWRSSILFLGIQILSWVIITSLSEGDTKTREELTTVLGTDPMPPFPIYMLNGMAIAMTVISGCILIAKRFENSRITDALNKTGQLALTFYVGHVVIGMGLAEWIVPTQVGEFPVEVSVSYALGFSLCCVLFAVIWRRYKRSGPLEWVMRKVTD